MADVGCSSRGKEIQGMHTATVRQHVVGSGYYRKRKTDFTTLCEIREQTRASIWWLTDMSLGAKTGINGWKLHTADCSLKGERIHYQRNWNQMGLRARRSSLEFQLHHWFSDSYIQTNTQYQIGYQIGQRVWVVVRVHTDWQPWTA